MKIAVLEFGNIPNEGSIFGIAEDLKLPVHRGRILNANSSARCITNVLSNGASREAVLFANSQFTNLNTAIGNMRERLGTSDKQNVGYVNLRAGTHRSRMSDVARNIEEWARHNGYEAVVWNDLPAKGIEFGQESTGIEVLSLLQQDSVLLENTKEYLNHLPSPLQNGLHDRVRGIHGASVDQSSYQASLTADFAERDKLPQSDTPQSQWNDGTTWGPQARTYPVAQVPADVDPAQWKRDRIIEVAKSYQGLPYKVLNGTHYGKRGHFPARGGGLDCSNFVSWVYNYGVGIKFSSDVDNLTRHDRSPNAGCKLNCGEAFEPGDFLVFKGNPKHVVIYIDENTIIDSTSLRPASVGVQITDFRQNNLKLWEKNHKPSWENPELICVRRPVS